MLTAKFCNKATKAFCLCYGIVIVVAISDDIIVEVVDVYQDIHDDKYD